MHQIGEHKNVRYHVHYYVYGEYVEHGRLVGLTNGLKDQGTDRFPEKEEIINVHLLGKPMRVLDLNVRTKGILNVYLEPLNDPS